jgi:RHS repeat-associated protein
MNISIYDDDGNRVMQVDSTGSITLFLGGGLYTIDDAAGTPVISKYYSIAGQHIAMDRAGTLSYLLTDHLGSVVAVADGSGNLVPDSQQRYMPFGQPRLTATGSTTDFTYTGQRALDEVGLMDYNARWYDATLGRFISADTVVPGASNPQALNRYAYVVNNPIILSDPSGNSPCDEMYGCGDEWDPYDNPDDDLLPGEPGYCETYVWAASCKPDLSDRLGKGHRGILPDVDPNFGIRPLAGSGEITRWSTYTFEGGYYATYFATANPGFITLGNNTIIYTLGNVSFGINYSNNFILNITQKNPIKSQGGVTIGTGYSLTLDFSENDPNGVRLGYYAFGYSNAAINRGHGGFSTEFRSGGYVKSSNFGKNLSDILLIGALMYSQSVIGAPERLPQPNY